MSIHLNFQSDWSPSKYFGTVSVNSEKAKKPNPMPHFVKVVNLKVWSSKDGFVSMPDVKLFCIHTTETPREDKYNWFFSLEVSIV